MAETTHKQPAELADRYSTSLDCLERQAQQPGWLTAVRRAGLARFTELGFPTLQHEDWRFTNVAPIAKRPFKPATDSATDGETAAALQDFPFAKLPGSRLVFLNGHYAAALSQIAALPQGVKVSNVAAVLAAEPALLEKHFMPPAPAGDNAFTALNQAFFRDGGFIHVPAGQ